MTSTPRASRYARLLWSLVLGLGLTLALLGVLMPHSAADAPADPHIRLEKNPTYYNAAGVIITGATSFYFDPDEAWTRYQAGELDAIAPPEAALGTIKASPVYSPQLHIYPASRAYFYPFSNDVPPFDDPLVCGAFASAIDRPRLINEALTGDELPALTFTPPNHFGHVDGYAASIGRPYSPTLAADLLAASGYTGDPPITLMFNSSPFNQAIAESIRQMWIETLGITVTLENPPWQQYLDLLRNGSAAERPGVFRGSWGSDYPDAHNWHRVALGFWRPLARYDSPVYDALVDVAAAETDPAARLALYEQAEATLVMTDTAIAPLFYYVNTRLARPDLARTYRSIGGQHLDEWAITSDPRPLEVAWGYPASLDPATSGDWDYLDQLFLGLTDFDLSGNVVPELATGWEVSADTRVYTFTMRSDAVWTDGNPVTAHDVEYGVLRSLDPKTGQNGWWLYIIENAQPYNQGDITDPGLVGVQALDDTHVRFTLAEPAAYFPVILSLGPARPQPRWTIEAHGDLWTDPANIVTNGPYKLADWDQLPYLGIRKHGDKGTPGEGSNFSFLIEYWNDGGAAAENSVISDTMEGMIYLADTSGFPHSGSGTPGDPVIWDLGTLPAHSHRDFDVFVQVTVGVSETIRNRAEISTSHPHDQGDPVGKGSEAGRHVGHNDTHLRVHKNAWTGDPAPGHEFVWSVNVCNNGSTNTSEVTLTDTLPISTTLVEWWSGEPGWVEVLRTDDQLVLSRPLIRDWDCRDVYLRFRLDEAAPRDLEISNTVTVAAANDLEDDDNISTDQVRVGEPYINLWLREGWTHGPLVPGGEIVYEMEYGNDGNIPADDVQITSTLPPHTSFDQVLKVPWCLSPEPAQVSSESVMWSFDTLEAGLHECIWLSLNVDGSATPGTQLSHRVEIDPQPAERSYEDNVITWLETLNPAGPNLEVYKTHRYDPGDDQIRFEVSIRNRGTEQVQNVTVTDTYPLGVTWDENWGGCHWTGVDSATHDEPNRQIVFGLNELAPGDYGCASFQVNLDDPGARLRWYTNTVGIDTPPGDTDTSNNSDIDLVFSGGEVDQVELEVGGHHIWGEAPDGPIHITTPSGSTEFPSAGYFDWDAPENMQPGDLVIVEAGAATHPVVIQLPDPFTAMADSNTGIVWGQIGVLDHEWLEVDLEGGPVYAVQTDGSGNFSATLPDVPRGGGEVRYRTEIDYAEVTFHHGLQSLDLIMQVNYGHDWVMGEYEAGHTLWVTVTESDGSTVKATAEVRSEARPEWGGQSGFQTDWDDWVPGPGVDIEAGDWVYGRVDNGNESAIHVGTIDGVVDMDADTIAGTIHAPWFAPQTLRVRCDIWEDNGPGGIEVVGVAADGGSYFCDFSSEWDILPGHDVAVRYREPDNEWVINMFEEPVPDMQVEKWVEGNEAAPGGPAVFTIRYRNEGDAVAETILLTDTLPANTAYVADSSGVLPVVGPGQVVWTLGPLDPGEQRQFHVVLSNSANVSDTLGNEVEVYTPFDSNDGNNHAEADVHVGGGQPDLNVNKNPHPGDPAPGQTFVYEINYANNGPVASGPVVLSDTLPAGTSVVSWTSQNGYELWEDVSSSPDELVLQAPSIPGHWGDQILLRLRVDPGVEVGTQLVNRVEVATDDDANPGDNWHQRDDVWVGEPRVNLFIQRDWESGQLVPGGDLRFDVVYGNGGNTAVNGHIRITDTLPEGTTFKGAWTWGDNRPVIPATVTDDYVVWEVSGLEPGHREGFGVTLDIDRDATPGAMLANTLEISPQPDEERYDDNASTWVGMVHEHGPNLQVHKRGFDWAGEDSIQYEIRVKNLGSQRLEEFWITDTYAESTAWTGDWWTGHGPWVTVTHNAPSRQLIFWCEGIDPGDTASLNLQVDLDEAVVGQQGLAFTNTLEAPIPGDVCPADNVDVVTAYAGIDLYAEKSISEGEPRPGARVTMTLQYGNGSNWPRGTSGSADLILTERLPPGMTYVHSLWPDGSANPPAFHDPVTGLLFWNEGQLGSNNHRWFYLVVDLDAGLEGGDVLLNQVELQQSPAKDVDYDLGNNLFELPVTVLGPKFDLAKTAAGGPAAGARLAYTLTVTNNGSEAGTSVLLSDTVPAGLTYGGGDGSFDGSDVIWNLGSITAHGGMAQGWFWGTLTCSEGELVNNAHYRVVSSDQGVTTPAGAPLSLTTVVPTLSPTFEQSAASVAPGGTVDFSDGSLTDGGSLVAWTWDFGDGQTGSGATTSHLYSALGTYTVTLTITDTCGFGDSISVPNAVTVEQLNIYLPLVTRG